jgi:hypothetical protein
MFQGFRELSLVIQRFRKVEMCIQHKASVGVLLQVSLQLRNSRRAPGHELFLGSHIAQ